MSKELFFTSVGRCIYCAKYAKLTIGKEQPWKETPISSEEAVALVLQGSRSITRICSKCWRSAEKTDA